MAPRMHGLSDEESDLWVALTVFSQVFTPAMDSRLRTVGLTLFEYGALMSVSDAPRRTLRISEMAERTYAPIPRMSKVVARLESRGLVARGASEADGRASVITLTAAGRRTLLEASRIQEAAARELVLDRIMDRDVDTLAAILGPLVHSLDPGGPVSPPGKPST
jgi:DNA-binding MarR family transcriptional regulator